MASRTTNLGLHLLGTSTADKETYFEQWRQTMNGETDDSNMMILDEVVGKLQDDVEPISNAAITTMLNAL